MTTYTGVADANGDFTVPFSSNYTSGQKITVTAEKDGATKNIELYAPSDAIGGGIIQFSGNMVDFPNNIGEVSIAGIGGSIGEYCFFASSNLGNIWKKATKLIIGNGVVSIGDYGFYNWELSKTVVLPASIANIGQLAFSDYYSGESLVLPVTTGTLTLGLASFQSWNNATQLTVLSNVANIPESCFSGWSACLSAEFPATVTSMGNYAASGWSSCNLIIMRSTTPPVITATTFNSLKSTCIIKVPAASVAAYKAATNWKTFASRIQAI